MADDPIIKFFREDLSEAEETALGERLSSSIEDALRFGMHAEASYRHYGLPEPKWPGGLPPAFYPKSGPRLGLWFFLALLAGLAAWGTWALWQGKGNLPAASIPSNSSLDTTLAPQAKPKPSTPPLEKQVIPDRLETHEADSAVSSATSGENQAEAPSSQPALTPVNVTHQPHHPHSNLEVLVHRAQPGPVTVRVMGPDGSQAVMLYQGLLQPGSWAFDWNGRLANGGAPASRTYQIQVVSGAVTMSKPVVLRKQP